MAKNQFNLTTAESIMEGVTPQNIDYGCCPQRVITVTTSLSTATNGAQPQQAATTATSVKPPARD